MTAVDTPTKDRPPRPDVSMITDVGTLSRSELRERGRALRKEVPRSSHTGWIPPPNRRDPLEILAESNALRVPELVPVRHGRMLASAFNYFRGAPAVMAHDLSTTATTSIRPQICGDAHVANFGLFATPERRLIFDLNDFDETLPGPFEWDVKRLAASMVIAARTSGYRDDVTREVVAGAVRNYAGHCRALAELATIDIWYLHADIDELAAREANANVRKVVERAAGKARTRTSLQELGKLTTIIEGRRVIIDDPPLVMHLPFETEVDVLRQFFDEYAGTLRADRQHLLRQYRLVDVARKVVGVGSVGTRCYIVLGAGRADLDPLFLQIKEAQASVLAPFCGPSEYGNHGERVVVGQRLMQAASDTFLGWSRDREGAEFFVRQLRDMKGGFNIETLNPVLLRRYADGCVWALARAHARTLDPALVSGYLGSGATFAEAVTRFAVDYADQTERDHAQLVEAVKDGHIEAIEGC
jgi:uncharacterized protein (DUF2252 family)